MNHLFTFLLLACTIPLVDLRAAEPITDEPLQVIEQLSFDEARDFLLSDRIYQKKISDILKITTPQHKSTIALTPYVFENQCKMIESGVFTKEQREQLWAICLRRNLNAVSIKNSFSRSNKTFEIRSIAADIRIADVSPLLRTIAPYNDLISLLPLLLPIGYYYKHPIIIPIDDQLNERIDEVNAMVDKKFIYAAIKVIVITSLICMASYKFIYKALGTINQLLIQNNFAQMRIIELFKELKDRIDFPQELMKEFLLFEQETPFVAQTRGKDLLEELKSKLPAKDLDKICYTMKHLLTAIERIAQLPPDDYETRAINPLLLDE